MEIIPQRQMYFDPENGSGVEEDFFAALTLLHSTDHDSVEMLRQILDALIAKKFGQTKTLVVRRSGCNSVTRKGENIELAGQNEPRDTQFSNIGELSKNRIIKTNIKAHASPNTAIMTTRIGQKMANVLVAVDRMEIPTISIPDEASSAGDGALCKICNGGRLGPLILLECQECQDVYHPLCHQPPVLDLDIYDPRLVWHCAKCVELSEAAATIAVAGLEDKKIQNKNSGISKNQIQLIQDGTIRNESKEQLDFFRRTKSRITLHHEDATSDQFQLRNRISIGRRSAKRQTRAMEQLFGNKNASLKNVQTSAISSTSSSVLHLRKRVGSKLTVTRGYAE